MKVQKAVSCLSCSKRGEKVGTERAVLRASSEMEDEKQGLQSLQAWFRTVRRKAEN